MVYQFRLARLMLKGIGQHQLIELSYSVFSVWQIIIASLLKGLLKGLLKLQHPLPILCEAKSLSGFVMSSMLLLMH